MSTMPTASPAPLYQQIKEYIIERIRSGEWQANAKIATEHALVAHFGVSRMTVNRALRELTAEGILTRIQGKGTYVAEAKPLSALFEVESIAQEIQQRGNVHTCDIHLLKEEPAQPLLAAEMGMEAHAPVYHSIIVHKENDRPVQLADRYVNPTIAASYLQQDFHRITPSAFLLQVAPITEVEHIIEALMPDEWIRELLHVSPAEPCLVLYRKTWAGEVVVTRSRFFYPGSGHRIGGRFKPVQPAGVMVT